MSETENETEVSMKDANEIMGSFGTAILVKIMNYLMAETGKYLKEGKGFDWIEKALVKKNKIPPDIAHLFIEGVKKKVCFG
jgi:hypothetical protein